MRHDPGLKGMVCPLHQAVEKDNTTAYISILQHKHTETLSVHLNLS